MARAPKTKRQVRHSRSTRYDSHIRRLTRSLTVCRYDTGSHSQNFKMSKKSVCNCVRYNGSLSNVLRKPASRVDSDFWPLRTGTRAAGLSLWRGRSASRQTAHCFRMSGACPPLRMAPNHRVHFTGNSAVKLHYCLRSGEQMLCRSSEASLAWSMHVVAIMWKQVWRKCNLAKSVAQLPWQLKCTQRLRT